MEQEVNFPIRKIIHSDYKRDKKLQVAATFFAPIPHDFQHTQMEVSGEWRILFYITQLRS